MSNSVLDDGQNTEELIPPARQLNGLLVTYQDDQLNECVKSALRRKSRVRYKCMDTYAHFLAFGTTGGAIYLYKLKPMNHSSCILILMIPCDQGSIEVIKFLPNPQIDDLLVAVGTARGSIVIFRLTQTPDNENPSYDEIYKAESFTNNYGIKMIECDQELAKLYICDLANRLYVLESSTIYAHKQSLRLFYSNHLPSLIFSVTDSKINQISVFKSQLLISTDETTRLFEEQTNQLSVIGKKKRKEGFYGACFFNSNYKLSCSDAGDPYMFVSRPMFRLWQVNDKREVMFTHQFEPLIKSTHFNRVVKLRDEPLREGIEDDTPEIVESFTTRESSKQDHLKGDHFEKLLQIYSSTLGNLLLSYNQYELFVVDPISANLIVYHVQEEPIFQVCCNENELFVWTTITDGDQRLFHIRRLVLMAPTQFVLELHRVHRYASIVMFVELFSEVFRQRMALPLTGTSIITTEGGLLRNVLLNAWDCYVAQNARNEDCKELKRMIEEIVEESKQLQRSFEDLTDSRFFLAMTNENIDRLCSEPYASLVSLEVSIKDLHTTHVIHFNKDALDRHKSVADLSRSIRNLNKINRKIANSHLDLNKKLKNTIRQGSLQQLGKSRHKVEFQAPERKNGIAEEGICTPIESPEKNDETREESEEEKEKERQRMIKSKRCANCKWPQPRGHLHQMDSSQRIQLNWIRENLINKFEENIDRLEKLSFNHGLWEIYLKCMLFKKQFEEYISFCMLLDDIRLLNVEQLMFGLSLNEDELFNFLLDNLSQKKQRQKKNACVKCGELYVESQNDQTIDERPVNDKQQEEQFCFSIVNLFEQFARRQNMDIKKFISHIRKYPELLNQSRIPATFYLKAVATATLIANRTLSS